MAAKNFKIIRDGLQDQLMKSRMKIQIYGGGFANGKTSGAVIKAMEMARMYPGSNGLIARSTYPKLNDTIRKEFIKWCPTNWIKSFPQSANSTNTCTLTNGTEINFRYIQQQGKRNEGSTSNLLSANFDWIVIDQIEDPEIVEKDFHDLLGRLRGSTKYIGDDPTMPETGPRWLIVTLNPTRNWVYKKLIQPYHAWLHDGNAHAGLLIEYDETSDGYPILDSRGVQVPKRDAQGRVIPIMQLIEGSTYENRDNLPADYIRTLEATYTGVMRQRFLLGMWASYEGLIYPMYNDTIHPISYASIRDYYKALIARGYNIPIREAYDHGMIAQSCYLFSFVDPMGNVMVLDGFYAKEQSVQKSIELIKLVREKWLGIEEDDYDAHAKYEILADPAVFRRGGTSDKAVVGATTSDLFWDNGKGLNMVRANNEIMNGIIKVQSYLSFVKGHTNPITGEMHDYEDGEQMHKGAPHIYGNVNLAWFFEELTNYYWSKNLDGEHIDKPQDGRDHAMDTLKYLLTRQPPVAEVIPKLLMTVPGYMRWAETETEEQPKAHRYG